MDGSAATANPLAYRRVADQDAAAPAHHPVVVVGAGPVGLTLAIDLAAGGQRVLLLDDDDTVANGSRAICFAKRTLEVWDRLGCGEAIASGGVTWNRGRVHLGDQALYAFDLLPESGHRRPAFVNIPQYEVERILLRRAAELPLLDMRGRNRVSRAVPDADGVWLTIETPDGAYALRADWLVAADGARSPLRGMLGLESSGQRFRDRFLIADVRMRADFPAERLFWFDPPFHRGQSVLLHQQPDDLWRIDFQLGWDADPELERRPERVLPRVQALLGPRVPFELEWVSVYTFACTRMERFRHGRVVFAGDAAHGVSPFGARGANGGVQDADNLGWKLRAVLDGRAPDALLDSYDVERGAAADENIAHSTRATDFITPKNDAARALRDAVLDLARDCAFARAMVNSGRLSLPTSYVGSALNTPDAEPFAGGPPTGAPAVDAPVLLDGRPDWLLGLLDGAFAALVFDADATLPVRVLRVTAAETPGAVWDHSGLAAARYDARPGTTYLLRPDGHVAARLRTPDPARIAAALARAEARAC